MNIELNKEELDFLTRMCIRALKLAQMNIIECPEDLKKIEILLEKFTNDRQR